METFLYIVFFLSCVLLIVAVLLQPGKTDAGALFTSNISSAALNPRGTQSVLSKLTIAIATIFMLSALLLSLPAITGNVSVLETQGEGGPTTEANTASENANAPAEGNTAPAGNAGSEEKGEEPVKGDEKPANAENTGAPSK